MGPNQCVLVRVVASNAADSGSSRPLLCQQTIDFFKLRGLFQLGHHLNSYTLCSKYISQMPQNPLLYKAPNLPDPRNLSIIQLC